MRLFPDSRLQDFCGDERGERNGYKKITAIYNAVGYVKTAFDKEID